MYVYVYTRTVFNFWKMTVGNAPLFAGKHVQPRLIYYTFIPWICLRDSQHIPAVIRIVLQRTTTSFWEVSQPQSYKKHQQIRTNPMVLYAVQIFSTKGTSGAASLLKRLASFGLDRLAGTAVWLTWWSNVLLSAYWPVAPIHLIRVSLPCAVRVSSL